MGDSENVCEPDRGDELACIDHAVREEQATPVAREGPNAVHLPMSSREQVLRWPRYAIVRRPPRGGRLTPVIHQLDGAEPLAFGAGELEIYLDAAGRPNPQIDDRSTWGPSDTLTLPVAHLVEPTPGAPKELVFDAAAGHRWTFQVHNLVACQPRFRSMVERTLMAFPIEHLQWGRLDRIYLDFIVGTSIIGIVHDRHGRPNLPRVCSGGANWPHDHSRADTGGVATVCATYSALNRPWGSHRIRTLPTTDAQIDAAMDDREEVAGTLYHEFGHIFHFLRPGRDRIPGSESDRLRAIRDNNGAGGLWDRHRIASGYGGRDGASQGFGEGFAEAYRVRLEGRSLRGSAAAEVDRALDAAGVPTSASAARAHRSIRDHLARHGS